MQSRLTIVGTALLLSACAAAADLPEFEAATIKPVDPTAMQLMELHVYPGGRLVINSESLKSLIVEAFNLNPGELKGGEDWMDSVRYRVEAKPPTEMRAKIPNAQRSWFGIGDSNVRAMLQALLIDRFQLKFHRESKEGTVYVLGKSGKPLLLKPVKSAPTEDADGKPLDPPLSGNISRVEGRGWFLINASMPQLARILSGTLRAPVLNQTDLDGYFDFQSKVIQTKEDFQDNGVGLLDAIKEMGLELKKTTGPVGAFVIAHAEKPRSD